MAKTLGYENDYVESSQIIRERELLQSAKNINLIEAEFSTHGYISLKTGIDEFFKLCQDNHIGTAFYTYRFYEKEDYLVTDEMIKANTFSKKEYKLCKEAGDKRNAEVESFDFEEPQRLYLYMVINGIMFFLAFKNNWMRDYQEAESFIVEFAESLDNLPLDDDDEGLDFFNLEDELREKLLSDSKFRLSTNKDMRGTYFREFMSKKENQKYLALFRKSANSFLRSQELFQLMNQIYAQYRIDCSRLKIRLGEELPPESEED